MPGKLEITKDTVQVVVESAAVHVGRIAGILSDAARQVTREVGDWATDVIEMREAADRARAVEAYESARDVEDEGDDEDGQV